VYTCTGGLTKQREQLRVQPTAGGVGGDVSAFEAAFGAAAVHTRQEDSKQENGSMEVRVVVWLFPVPLALSYNHTKGRTREWGHGGACGCLSASLFR
jgi:hypothetical protein